MAPSSLGVPIRSCWSSVVWSHATSNTGNPGKICSKPCSKIQLRLADYHFEQVHTFAEVQSRHASFVETYNITPHFAHQEREDGSRTPSEVLAWARGQPVTPATLQTVLRDLQFERMVDRRGYVRIQRFYIYAERGMARQRVSVWVSEGRLQIAYRETVLARYTAQYDRKRKRVRSVQHPTLYHSPYASPQLELWELDDDQWHKVLERPVRSRRKVRDPLPPWRQLPLPLVGSFLFLLTWVVCVYMSWFAKVW